ncbi:hypothetical protein Tco_0482365 [Tanacetum coccineum]
MHDGSSFILEDVKYVPGLKRSLISLGTLKKEGYTVKMQMGRIKVIKGCRVMMTGIRKKNCVYTLEAKVVTFGVQKHGGPKQVGFKQLGHKQVGFKQLGPGVETGVHMVQDEKRVWFEVELQGAQGDRKAEVFEVSNDDVAVAQRRLGDKQLEEKTNMDCLVKEQEKLHLGIKVRANITVTGGLDQEGEEAMHLKRCTMPNARDVDHHDTASYIPLYHHTGGFTGDERDIDKSLVYRLFHKGRVILPDFLEDEPNLRPTFRVIGFDCLLDIDDVETILTLENFAQILIILCEGVCLYSHEWSISSLQRSLDPHPNLYPHPTEEPSLVRDALLKERPEPILRKIKGDSETLEPFQMLNTEFKDTFNKWYLILNENVICLTGHKDHPNVSLCYMLYCLSIGKEGVLVAEPL